MPIEKIGGEPSRVEDNERERDDQLQAKKAFGMVLDDLVKKEVIDKRFALTLLRAEKYGEIGEVMIGLSENLGMLQGRVEDGEMEREEADGIRKRLIEEALDKVSAHVIKDTLLKSLAERRHLNRSEKVVAIGEIMIGLSEELGLLQGQVEDVKIKNEEAD